MLTGKEIVQNSYSKKNRNSTKDIIYWFLLLEDKSAFLYCLVSRVVRNYPNTMNRQRMY